MRTVHDCPACASGATETIASLDADRAGRLREFDRLKYGGLLSEWIDSVPPVVARCRSCGHAWYRHQPEPDQLARMYAAGRPLLAGVSASDAPSPAMRAEMRRLRRLMASGATQPSLLDFGSGRGRWARAAVLEGFRVVAYEPIVERTDADAPFRLVHSTDQLAGTRFDAIQLEQVLEHVPDPLATLTQLNGYCGAGTIVRVTVPNILRDPTGDDPWASWPFNGTNPHVLAPFEHLHGFTPASLLALARRAGFDVVSGWRLARNYPLGWMRQVIRPAWPRWGSTFALLTKSPRPSPRPSRTARPAGGTADPGMEPGSAGQHSS